MELGAPDAESTGETSPSPCQKSRLFNDLTPIAMGMDVVSDVMMMSQPPAPRRACFIVVGVIAGLKSR